MDIAREIFRTAIDAYWQNRGRLLSIIDSNQVHVVQAEVKVKVKLDANTDGRNKTLNDNTGPNRQRNSNLGGNIAAAKAVAMADEIRIPKHVLANQHQHQHQHPPPPQHAKRGGPVPNRGIGGQGNAKNSGRENNKRNRRLSSSSDSGTDPGAGSTAKRAGDYLDLSLTKVPAMVGINMHIFKV
jgi:hypothetical protein